jgi:hypothetical protein
MTRQQANPPSDTDILGLEYIGSLAGWHKCRTFCQFSIALRLFSGSEILPDNWKKAATLLIAPACWYWCEVDLTMEVNSGKKLSPVNSPGLDKSLTLLMSYHSC